MGIKWNAVTRVRPTKQNAAPVDRSGKEVRWNKGFAGIHEREMNGGLRGGSTVLGPLYTELFLGVGLDNCGHCEAPKR
jgi:hypothetical protein